MNLSHSLSSALLLVGTAPLAVFGQTILVAEKDNTLYESTNGSLSNGAGKHLFAGRTNQGFGIDKRRGLIEFDVAGAIPAGSTITGVALKLNMSMTFTGIRPVALHRALAEWGEGASDADGEEGTGTQSEPGDATWVHTFFPGSAWTNAGGDFVAASSASTDIGGQGFYTWSSAQMIADVQSFLDDPASNHGWVLVGLETASGGTAKRFDSRDHLDPTVRPQLTITIDGGSATGACCFPVGVCDELTESDCTAQGGLYQGDGTECDPNPCPVTLTPYLDPLPLPAVATPILGTPGGSGFYEIAVTEFQQQLHSQLAPTTVWGYDGTFPGPTFEAWRDAAISVKWINDLRDPQGNLRTEHLLPVDPCPHGAALNDARTVTHLHGGHTPAASDGYPEDTILPGQDQTFLYPNHQFPSALWYHDHSLGITRLNVILGLAGFYIIRDQFEVDLGLPSDEFELPLVIQDRSFNADGSFDYPAEWQQHFFGDKILVNGKVWPYHEVAQGKYRLRVLNGSNARAYTLALSTGDAFQVIGGDGGLLPAPLSVTEHTLTPGERSDWIVDFSGYPAGTEVLLTNSAPAPFPGVPGIGVVPEVLQFIVTADAGHTAPVPASLRPQMPLPESSAVQEREFLMQREVEPCAGSQWLINGLAWDDITEIPQLGTTEIWSFVNDSNITHPMHMHLVFFQVLDRQDFDIVGGQVVPSGVPVPPDPTESGWKDTVQAPPNQITRVIARFTDYEGLYAYHCHILEHEDHEMMRQFQSVSGPGIPYCFCDGTGPCGNDDADAGCANATGFGGYLSGHGSASISQDDLVLTSATGEAGTFGVFFRGMNQTDAPFGDGRRCVGAGPVQRLPMSPIDPVGVARVGPGLVQDSQATSLPILGGDTWNWQFWYRDPNGPCGSGFNLTNGLSVVFAP